MKKSVKGYLLIEILIGIAIILIISVIAIPNFKFFNQQLVNSETEKLQMAFNYMQFRVE